MFSQACVKNSVHKGGRLSARDPPPHPPLRQTRQMPPRQTSQMAPGQTPLADGYGSGRYASYWNACCMSPSFSIMKQSQSESESFRVLSPSSGARKPPRGTVSIPGHNGHSGERQMCYHDATKPSSRRGRQPQSWGSKSFTLPILSQKLQKMKFNRNWTGSACS